MLAERFHPEPIPSLTETPSMARRRKREPEVLIAAARFLPTMLARFLAAFPILTNIAGRSCVAPLQRRHVSPRRRGGRPFNEAAKGCKTFPVSVRDA